jgi:Cu-processing system permease protein
MKKILVMGLISGLCSTGAFAGACTFAGTGAAAAAVTTPATNTEQCACNGGTAQKTAINGGPGAVVGTPVFAKTGFDVQCSSNTVVSYNEVSGTLFAVAAGSGKGNQLFGGNSAPLGALFLLRWCHVAVRAFRLARRPAQPQHPGHPDTRRLLVGVAYLSASFSPRQPQTVALDVGLSGLRITLILFSLFWVQELVAREIERRTVLFALTYPVARGRYIVGRYLGVLGLLALAAVLLGMLLWRWCWPWAAGLRAGFAIAPGLPYWLHRGGLVDRCGVVPPLRCGSRPSPRYRCCRLALGLAFAVAGKSLGAVAEYLAKGADGDPTLMRFAPIIDAIQWVLPDLSRLDWRASGRCTAWHPMGRPSAWAWCWRPAMRPCCSRWR